MFVPALLRKSALQKAIFRVLDRVFEILVISDALASGCANSEFLGPLSQPKQKINVEAAA